MKKTVQKFIGDAIRDVLKAGATPSGMDLPYLVQILKCFVIRVIRLGTRWQPLLKAAVPHLGTIFFISQA